MMEVVYSTEPIGERPVDFDAAGNLEPELITAEDEEEESSTRLEKDSTCLTLSFFSDITMTVNEALQDISSRPNPHFTLEKLRVRIQSFLRNFFKDMKELERKMAERPQEIAQKMFLSKHYPIEHRIKMFKHFDAGDYNKVAEIALDYDKTQRGRPHKGKAGPEDPLKVYNEG